MKIKAYLKPHCGWSMGVRAIFQKYDLPYQDIDIINFPENYAEMVRKSGQPLSPCVEIDGIMLADVRRGRSGILHALQRDGRDQRFLYRRPHRPGMLRRGTRKNAPAGTIQTPPLLLKLAEPPGVHPFPLLITIMIVIVILPSRTTIRGHNVLQN